MKKILYSILAGVGMLLGPSANAGVAVLELQRSTALDQWETIHLDPSLLTTGGGILQATNDSKAFYRLKVNGDQNAGFVAAMTLADAPRRAVDIAQQFLKDALLEDEESQGGDEEGSWQDVELSQICYPVYDPASGKAIEPAYLEFKVIKKPLPLPDPPPESRFLLSAPDESRAGCDYGHILVSLTERDFPIAEYSQGGPTPVEVLLKRSRGNGPIKPVRFDDGLLVGEDGKGELVVSMGNEPFMIDPQVLTVAGREFEGLADEKGEQGESPEFAAKGYASYREMKADFAENPLYQELRRLRAEMAKPEWDLYQGIEPPSIQVPVQKRTYVLPNQQIQSASLQDSNLAELILDQGKPGLWILGLQEGGTTMHVVNEDGSSQTYLLLVGSAASQGASLNLAVSGWTAWQYWYAGNWGNQRRYNQFWKDSQMCSGGWSGCGPAAWAMLYGWWDRKGSPRCMKNSALADAPLFNDNSVRDCTRYVFNRLGPFCVNGQAATMPWNMKNGYKWGQARGAGYSISWSWGVPYLSPGSRNRAISSIKNGRPAIVGLGFYWHYPLAYGYAERKYKFLGITVSTSRYFKCNMGWGGSSPQWKNASSTWFGTHGRYW